MKNIEKRVICTNSYIYCTSPPLCTTHIYARAAGLVDTARAFWQRFCPRTAIAGRERFQTETTPLNFVAIK